jgi:hypothetical protein
VGLSGYKTEELITLSNGDKYWCTSSTGEYHRIDEPALYRGGDKYWYKHGELHRINGPACEFESFVNGYYLYGYSYTKEEYNKLIENIPLLYWNRFKEGKEWY